MTTTTRKPKPPPDDKTFTITAGLAAIGKFHAVHPARVHCETPACQSVHEGGWGSAVDAGWRTDACGLRRCRDCLDDEYVRWLYLASFPAAEAAAWTAPETPADAEPGTAEAAGEPPVFGELTEKQEAAFTRAFTDEDPAEEDASDG